MFCLVLRCHFVNSYTQSLIERMRCEDIGESYGYFFLPRSYPNTNFPNSLKLNLSHVQTCLIILQTLFINLPYLKEILPLIIVIKMLNVKSNVYQLRKFKSIYMSVDKCLFFELHIFLCKLLIKYFP